MSNYNNMEEEMRRFEAEISGQVSQPSHDPGKCTSSYFLPHQIRANKPYDVYGHGKISGPSHKAVIAAPAKISTPQEMAVKRAGKKEEAMADDDDDVTRALLAAAAGVTYNNPAPPPAPVPNLTQPPPMYSSSSTSTIPDYPGKKKKKFLRIAAGQVWDDPTLNEWDPDDFRMFCGDLGPEVNDDTLTRVFSRYSSFKKARVVRDKRTNKTRGYGFVSFSDPDDFTRAMREVNGKYVGNRPIKLKKSDWKTRQLDTHKKREKEKKKLGLKV